jgi:hypothetical protein
MCASPDSFTLVTEIVTAVLILPLHTHKALEQVRIVVVNISEVIFSLSKRCMTVFFLIT